MIGVILALPFLYLVSSFIGGHYSATAVTSVHHSLGDHSKKHPAGKKTKSVPAVKYAQPNKKLWNSGGVVNVKNISNQQWLQHIQKSDFQAPSDGPYPKIKNWNQIWIDANISKQRIYIKKGNQTLYTMLTSSGLDTKPDNSTPLGTFHVQAQRGKFFYSAQYKEGAEYWTSWKNHGEFLFHSVPVNKQGKIIKGVADQLGHKASHGCFHLTFADAKWILDHVPVGTKVVIHN